MLGILLITWKNGRTVKTYGLNRLENYNMKFTFICIVIVLSCSVCASGDLEIYPGFKYDLSSEEQRPRLESEEEGVLYAENYRRWPWQDVDDWNRKKEQEFDLELPELRNLEKLLDRNQNDDLPAYYNSRPSFDNAYDEYKPIEKLHKFDRFNFRYPNSQILDDVRPYPHEDDFTFGDEEVKEERDLKPHEPQERHQHEVESMGDNHHHSSHMVVNTGEKNNEEASGKGALEEAPILEDLSQFAYLPTDARFFQNTESDNGDQKVKTKLEKIKDNKIRLIHRSDEAFVDEMDSFGKTESREKNDQVKVVAVQPQGTPREATGVYIIGVVAGISAAATVGLIAVGLGWYNLQKHVKNASDVEYPAYGVTGPNKDASPSGDRRLAQSAQMYHYQHQKQQIIAMERAAAGERHGSVSEADSDEENEEGDYTVYECPGLAPTGEMEVKNPLFQDDPTPAQTPPVKPNEDEKK
ncbi:protein cab-1 isoform X2 [Tribolium madens]|uniref:protein cab-1 isoform X2 n=1 Tax=Tribolium madens TaxID=41895 RepID=UPI001CF72F6F|nr:protein cab-1 isoform X2 [Tribolium madens]